jgi:beta-glucosidase
MNESGTNKRIKKLIRQMTIEEKVGQLIQKNSDAVSDSLIKSGGIGSVLNQVDVKELNRLQRIAVEESRLGIPLVFARDVIHGFKTIFPIPLGQAATWSPELIQKAAEVSAVEASSVGIHWTFAPMIDVTRDPRWGRIAESFGEDPYLASVLAKASIDGYQGESLSDKNTIAACAKHFAAYGAAEAGRDYHTVTLPENELRDVYLPPFKAASDAGAATFMNAFNEINGIPATGHELLLKDILRTEWNYKGMVVSDWFSVQQMVIHGYALDEKDAALKAIQAGVDMEMASTCYEDYLISLVKERAISEKVIDEAVANVLKLKFDLGLFDNPYTNPEVFPLLVNDNHREVSKQVARESLVLLKNENSILPLSTGLKNVAVIGPLADQPHDQMGTWVFDGDKEHSVTPLESLKKLLGNRRVHYAPGLTLSRDKSRKGFTDAVEAANKSDVVIMFLGEESILSGESHCRADITLPGAQNELIKAVSETGKPIIAVVMAGRPLTFEEQAIHFDALLYAWHPGTMAGPAISDIIFGFESPSGKLPVTFPRTVGQIPLYYSQKNSGKPATDATWERMEEIPAEAPQLSVGNTNHYIDYGFEPWFPFGYGLSYTTFEYSNVMVTSPSYSLGDNIEFSAVIKNTGEFEAKETVQLYVRDIVGSRTRPVKELKAFRKILLKPGESQKVFFTVNTDELGFHNQQMKYVTEPGHFIAGIGGSSSIDLTIKFELKDI